MEVNVTFNDLLNKFTDTFPSAIIDDYRPICHEIFTDEKSGITIWLDNGDIIEYYPNLEILPSTQSKRNLGRWIYEERKRLIDETDDGPVYRTEKWWLCSECRYAKGYQISKPSSNYCENCSAKMQKDDE